MFSQSLWALAAAALFSLMATFIKMSAGHFGTFELVFYRSLFGVLFIASYVWIHGLTLKPCMSSDTSNARYWERFRWRSGSFPSAFYR